jgi:pSer/pThr/pTyr-binding forkhead associated (FHA) protein
LQSFGVGHLPKLLVGRGPDCPVSLSGFQRDQLISRHHCVLEIAPPRVWVRDLASRNGTFVNGHRIGVPKIDARPGEHADHEGWPLEDGDVLTVGGTSLRVSITGGEADEGLQRSEVSDAARPVTKTMPYEYCL